MQLNGTHTGVRTSVTLADLANESYGMADNKDNGRRRLSDLEARDAAARYEAVDAGRVNRWLLDLLPNAKACILDVGSGSGRDAAWLAALGHDVLAIEPDPALRRENERHHPDGAYQLLTDSLPSLAATSRTGLSFDFILLNAVWMFVAPAQRERAFRKLVTLLKPGGAIALTLRGPVDVGSGMHAASVGEIENLARRHGAYVDRTANAPDFLGRRHITWEQVLVRVPDDGTGALPLIRRIVLNDDKSSTYKLALIRTISRVAHSAPGVARRKVTSWTCRWESWRCSGCACICLCCGRTFPRVLPTPSDSSAWGSPRSLWPISATYRRSTYVQAAASGLTTVAPCTGRCATPVEPSTSCQLPI